ncbi:MAG: THUMP domain-containing protein [Desulfurococcales archaeon]|nr:THUMP domain-containing protein [Desulfurococcales archaeon]
MKGRFNLVVSHLPGAASKREAIRELKMLIDDFEVRDVAPNLIYGWVKDPLGAVETLRSNLPSNTTILRVIPVMAVTPPYVDSVKSRIVELLEKAGQGSIAIRLDGYLQNDDGLLLHKREAIEALAEGLDRRVNLDNPDILVYIKVYRLRNKYVAGIYVGPKSGILSIPRERR